jgi:uncharacterized membrane protein YhhN
MTAVHDVGVLWVLALGLVFAPLNWIAVGRGVKRLEYVCKPATLALFLIAALMLANWMGWTWVATWFVAALLLSLIGDVLLMLPGDRWFLPGLLAFLLGHIAYIVGFNATLPPPEAFILLPFLAILDWVILRKLVASVQASKVPEMRVPVIFYGVVLTLTMFSGLATWLRPGWGWEARMAASVGGILFLVSDVMLAWVRFVHRSRPLAVAVMVTYHLAQLSLLLVIGLAP